MNKISFILLLTVSTLFACQESMEDRAVRDAYEYTRKYCPTPVINCTRTDSVTFSRKTHVYTYYISFVDKLDDRVLIEQRQADIEQMLRASLRENTGMKQYLEAGFKFVYVCRSAKDGSVLIKINI